MRRTLTLALVATAFHAVPAWAQSPSQRELNGFLIGQSDRAIAGSFVTLLQADTTSDGWVNRVYLLDRAHHAYMAFKFPADRPHQTISVQVAGDSGTDMLPFLGIRLGDHSDALLARLGRPSSTSHETDVNVDLHEYEGRNYSVEVDSQGRVSSIQIFGTKGFPNRPTEVSPSLDTLWAGLELGGRAALEQLGPDAEVYRGDSTITFEHAALADIQAASTPIAGAFLHGPQSVRGILADTSVRRHADGAIRVWEHHAPGWVWKFPATTPISEIAFVVDAGRWRVWEVQYR
jgi:hypothetical protein